MRQKIKRSILLSFVKENAGAEEKPVSPAYVDEDKVSLLLPIMKRPRRETVIFYSFIQDQDEATREVDTTLQEFYYESEKKSSRSEGSEEEEAEGHGERLPLSIST